MLVRGLPMESRTQTSIRDRTPVDASPSEPSFGPWALIHYQMASLIDAVNAVAYYTAAAVTAATPTRPEPVPRPLGRVRRLSRTAAEKLARLHPAKED